MREIGPPTRTINLDWLAETAVPLGRYSARSRSTECLGSRCFEVAEGVKDVLRLYAGEVCRARRVTVRIVRLASHITAIETGDRVGRATVRAGGRTESV